VGINVLRSFTAVKDASRAAMRVLYLSPASARSMNARPGVVAALVHAPEAVPVRLSRVVNKRSLESGLIGAPEASVSGTLTRSTTD
jgi:hypothetical protein